MLRKSDSWVDFIDDLRICLYNIYLNQCFTENFFLSDPDLQGMADMSYLSHQEKYEESIRRLTIVLKKVKKLQKSEGWNASDLNR